MKRKNPTTPNTKEEEEVLLAEMLKEITIYLCQATETTTEISEVLRACGVSIKGGNRDTIKDAIPRVLEAIRAKNAEGAAGGAGDRALTVGPTTANTWKQTTPPRAAIHTPLKKRGFAINSSPSPTVARTVRRAKARRQIPQTPQRGSGRNIEPAQKSAQNVSVGGRTAGEGEGPVAADPVTEGTAGGGLENTAEEPAVEARTPFLAPRADAGVSKRGGRRGGRRGRRGGAKRG